MTEVGWRGGGCVNEEHLRVKAVCVCVCCVCVVRVCVWQSTSFPSLRHMPGSAGTMAARVRGECVRSRACPFHRQPRKEQWSDIALPPPPAISPLPYSPCSLEEGPQM